MAFSLQYALIVGCIFTLTHTLIRIIKVFQYEPNDIKNLKTCNKNNIKESNFHSNNEEKIININAKNKNYSIIKNKTSSEIQFNNSNL